ncbi:hypothetical protein Mapa_007266 [Marchantia paleacea]|nr:hypothetical protein Mapa_007266 [Marchantia paleacea]
MWISVELYLDYSDLLPIDECSEGSSWPRLYRSARRIGLQRSFHLEKFSSSQKHHFLQLQRRTDVKITYKSQRWIANQGPCKGNKSESPQHSCNPMAYYFRFEGSSWIPRSFIYHLGINQHENSPMTGSKFNARVNSKRVSDPGLRFYHSDKFLQISLRSQAKV